MASLALALASCGSNVMLDNPRGEAVVFTFDSGDAHMLNAGEMKDISLSAGNHTVTVKGQNGQVLADTHFTVKEGGLVHSGGSNYVVWRQLYGLQTDRKTLLHEDWTLIDSTKFFGDFKVYPHNWLYIESNWTLGLEETMPETQALYVTKDYKLESKVFREADFVTTYRDLAQKNKKQQ